MIRLFFVTFLFISSIVFAKDIIKTSDRDIKFRAWVDSLDFNADNITWAYKSGTTSVGLKIYINQKYVGYWYPHENASADSEGQVVSYFIGRFLRVNKQVLPSHYLYLTGPALQDFLNYLVEDINENQDEAYEWRVYSQNVVREAVENSITTNTPHFGAISKKIKKFEVIELSDYKNNTLNVEHPISQFIKADGPMPSDETIHTFDSFNDKDGKRVNTATEMDLAKDLSRIMIIDMLVGQWDRFSGGNLEAYFDESDENKNVGRIRFIARDNGGNSFTMHPDDQQFLDYLPLVTRFDKDQVKELKKLQKQYNSDPKLIERILRIKTKTPNFAKRIDAVLAHIEKQVEIYGKDKAYFDD